MILCIDIGNTNTVLGVFKDFDNLTILNSWRLRSLRDKTSDELSIEISSLFSREGFRYDDFPQIIISSVVPDLTLMYADFIKKYFSRSPLIVTSESMPGLAVKVDQPKSVGSDRLVNSFAARHLYGKPAIVVDFGTATTFDVIGPDGSYEGGVIAPGITLSSQALSSRAALLPRIDLAAPERVIGKNTVEAMQAGIFLGYVCLIEGLLSRIERELNLPETQTLKVIATGGLAPLFAKSCPVLEIIDSDLTLKGLCLIGRET